MHFLDLPSAADGLHLAPPLRKSPLPSPTATKAPIAPSGILPRIGMIGNFPPRRCGIATYTIDMTKAILATKCEVSVYAMDDGAEDLEYPEEVAMTVRQSDPFAYLELARRLNADCDVALLQHEYGIFGGEAGEDILLTLRQLKVPVVTVLHTILEDPSPAQRRVLCEIADRSATLVVMSETAKEILSRVYRIDAGKVAFVPHGVPDPVDEPRKASKRRYGWRGRRVILTFGLLSPGKGIEFVLDALAPLVQQHPDIVYVLAGQTHPHIRRSSGEAYRNELLQQARAKGISQHIEFIDRYLGLDELCDLLNACDVYVTPYLNPQQITSGTLSYAVGAGRTVVSTGYLHAKELLGDGTGILVPFRCADSIAEALSRVLSDPTEQSTFEKRALVKGEEMRWSRIGETMTTIARDALTHVKPEPIIAFREVPRVDLGYLSRLVDDTGVLQHATYDVPNRDEGYCSDDNARVLTLAQSLIRAHGSHPELERIESVALSFLGHAWNPEVSRFRNFMDYGRGWLESVGSEESQGRTFAALARSARQASTEGKRRFSLQLALQSLSGLREARYVRTRANVLCGLADLAILPDLREESLAIGRQVVQAIKRDAEPYLQPDWEWVEPGVYYDNGRIPEGLIRFAVAAADPEPARFGLRLLRWLDQLHHGPMGLFLPIGCEGFYHQGGPRAIYDQQPIEAASMIQSYQAAFEFDHDRGWLKSAERAFAWFRGENVGRVPMADSMGAYDGLNPRGANHNRGAESTWAYLAANVAFRQLTEQSAEPTVPFRSGVSRPA